MYLRSFLDAKKNCLLLRFLPLPLIHNCRKMLFTWPLPQTQSNQGPCPTGVEMVQIHNPKRHIPLQQPQDSYLNPGVEPNQAVGYLHKYTHSEPVASLYNLVVFLNSCCFTRALVFLLLTFKFPFIYNQGICIRTFQKFALLGWKVKFVIRCSRQPYISVNQGAGVKRKIPCHYLSVLPVLPAPKSIAGDARLVLLLALCSQVPRQSRVLF